jgi:hypothetical protein
MYEKGFGRKRSRPFLGSIPGLLERPKEDYRNPQPG